MVIFSYFTIVRVVHVEWVCTRTLDKMFSLLAATPAFVASRGECTPGYVVSKTSVAFRCTLGSVGRGKVVSRVVPLVVGLGPFGGKGHDADVTGAHISVRP